MHAIQGSALERYASDLNVTPGFLVIVMTGYDEALRTPFFQRQIMQPHDITYGTWANVLLTPTPAAKPSVPTSPLATAASAHTHSNEQEMSPMLSEALARWKLRGSRASVIGSQIVDLNDFETTTPDPTIPLAMKEYYSMKAANTANEGWHLAKQEPLSGSD